MFIKNQGNPFPGSALIEEVPEINLDLWEIAPTEDTPAGSGEFNAGLATSLPKGMEEKTHGVGCQVAEAADTTVPDWGPHWPG